MTFFTSQRSVYLRVETGNIETASFKVSTITSYNRGVINSAKTVLNIILCHLDAACLTNEHDCMRGRGLVAIYLADPC
jgi:hypothetical protein